ncbi:MAG TPA: patatin-like phospholipase family protein [Thermoanaerobaculia bacterium]|nr:patatin-like phospholipase family protein [Thermoanaerobaculia bacterium]
MATLPQEVHEILEQEYVTMYGPLPRTGTEYQADQITDETWAMRILRACGLVEEKLKKPGIATRLNELLADLPVEQLLRSPVLTNLGRTLVERYPEFLEAAQADGKVAELHRRILDDAFGGAVRPLRDLRLSCVYGALHQRAKEKGKERTALCISGGGIRSATFALGVIQGLASAKILDRFDYLSTVSGGGYIGSWLSSWTRRHPHGISGVQEDLAQCDTAVAGARHASLPDDAEPERPEARDEKIEPEPKPLRHLRDFSNYLSPKLGLLSGDSWTLGALYLRNLMLNLLVLIPIIAAVLAVPRAYAVLARGTLVINEWLYPVLTVVFIAIAFGYIGLRRPVDFEQAEAKGTDGESLLWCVLPLLGASISLSLFWADVARDPEEWRTWWVLVPGILAMAAMTLIPWALYHNRLRDAYANAPSTTFAEAESLRRHLRKKGVLELGGALLGMLTAAGLMVLLAVKVFDQPLLGFTEMLDQAAGTAPALRVHSTTPWSSLYVVFGVPAVMLVFFVQASIFVGLSSRRNEDYDREWWGRGGAWLIAAAAAWAALAAVTIFGPVALYNAPVILASVGGLSGLAAGLLGFSGTTPANAKQKEEAGLTAKASNAGLALAVPLFVLFFLSAIALGTTWLAQEIKPMFELAPAVDYGRYTVETRLESKTKRMMPTTTPGGEAVEVTAESKAAALVSLPELRSLNHYDSIFNTTYEEILAICAVALAAWFLSRRIGVNRFSMHALYRNRLIRAYLGASRYSRRPNPFSGFDPRDDIPMYQLRPELLWSCDLRNPESFFHALVEGERDTQTNLSGEPLQRRKLAQHIWNRLYPKTRTMLRGEGTKQPIRVTATAVDAVIHNVNAILLDETQLLEAAVELPKDFWATNTDENQVPYPATLRNRAVFDHYFRLVLRPMARPKDAPSDEVRLTLQQQGNLRKSGDGVPRRAPLHVVNMALNLVSGEKLAWQQRMAETFTSTPYHTGNVFLGYRDSRVYGGREGISLGTTVTISGAAASPNMGYHSSPALAFLLTLFNIRLGSWLGNPGPAGQKVYREGHPDSNLQPMFYEAVGKTNDTFDWVYLSDGGHFENLGLYEMVLRRCHVIVLSDAGADPKYSFEDLGNAIRKIRTDLGVPIDIEKTFMFPRGADSVAKEGRYVATATIRYTAVDGAGATDGRLVYLKPGCYNDDHFPRDVYNYALESDDFPHEPTSDQFFSESQFESYRALGRHAINEICGNYPKQGSKYDFPIARQFDDVGHFAECVAGQYGGGVNDLPPAQLIASAIRQLKG